MVILLEGEGGDKRVSNLSRCNEYFVSFFTLITLKSGLYMKGLCKRSTNIYFLCQTKRQKCTVSKSCVHLGSFTSSDAFISVSFSTDWDFNPMMLFIEVGKKVISYRWKDRLLDCSHSLRLGACSHTETKRSKFNCEPVIQPKGSVYSWQWGESF